jgi:Ala-tRNA(Pro) deacylase
MILNLLFQQGGCMNLQTYLDEMGVTYSLSRHPAVYTAQALAEVEHVPGRQVVKPVVVLADGRFVLCALPASYRIDLAKMRELLHAKSVALADEVLLRELFPDCELGAEPPIGRLYGLPTYVDPAVIADERVTFQAGTHVDAITMHMSDYRRITQGQIATIGRPC